MAGGRPPSFRSFTCPNCQALFHVVKVEAEPETFERSHAPCVGNHWPVAKASLSSNTSCCQKPVVSKSGDARRFTPTNKSPSEAR
jgi:hypothetical protein